MNWIECLLILAGASMEIFASMICHGSVIRKVNIMETAIICGIVTVGQTAALLIGYWISSRYFQIHPDLNGIQLGEILAAFVLILMGIRLILKAFSREWFVERLERNFRALKFVRFSLYTAIYTILAGIAFGFLGTDMGILTGIQIVLTLAGTIGGIYTGYHYGFTVKTGAYAAGAVLFWCSGAELILHYILEIL